MGHCERAVGSVGQVIGLPTLESAELVTRHGWSLWYVELPGQWPACWLVAPEPPALLDRELRARGAYWPAP